MCLDVVRVVEFESVHGKNHPDEVTESLCAHGGGRPVAGIEVVPTSVNALVVWNIGVK